MDDARKPNKYDTETYQYWTQQLSSAQQDRDNFIKKGQKIVSRYRDEDRVSDTEKRYNILYSNTETLAPVVYSSKPIPDSRARDTKNIAARKASAMIDAALGYYINNEFDYFAKLAVKDFLLPGLGVMRPYYKPLIQKTEEEVNIADLGPDDKFTTDDATGKHYREVEEVVNEEIEFGYIYWKDVIEPVVTTYATLPWKAYRSFVTKNEAIELVGKKKAELLIYSEVKVDEETKNKPSNPEKKAELYEIWDKEMRQQIFYSESMAEAPLLIEDDPLGLEGFFPTPRPMLSSVTSGSIIPVPFYVQYQDQAMELDDINDRISALINNMRRRGFYDKKFDELVNLNNLGDNELFPVDNWNELLTKGGLAGVTQFEDITSYVNALSVLVEKRKMCIDDIYQIIGLADIRRGQTDPRETLGAQKMKGRYGTIRVSTQQKEVARFFRDLLSIAGEIIINHFAPETIASITGIPVEDDIIKNPDGSIKEVVAVGVSSLLTSLREKSPSDIIIDIQTDSTIIDDDDADKEDLKDIISALAEFVGAAQPLVQMIGIEATAKLLMGIVQKFKLGRNIQQEVQDHIDQLKEQAKAAEGKPPEPSDEIKIAQMVLQEKTMELQLQAQKDQVDAGIKKAELAIKQQANFLKAQELSMYHEIEKQYVDIKAIDSIIHLKEVKAEAANKNDNAVVGA